VADGNPTDGPENPLVNGTPWGHKWMLQSVVSSNQLCMYMVRRISLFVSYTGHGLP